MVLTQLYHVGFRGDDGTQKTTPTVIVTCGSRKGRKIVKKAFNEHELGYLEQFAPVLFQYEPAPASWSAHHSPSVATVAKTTLSKPKAIWIENDMHGPRCGLTMKLYLGDGDDNVRYSTFGGRLLVDGRSYGILPGHVLTSDSGPRDGTSESDDSGYDTDSSDLSSNGHQSATNTFCTLSVPNTARENIDFDPIWRCDGGPRRRSTFTRPGESDWCTSDWALFQLPKQFYAANVYTTALAKDVEISSVASHDAMQGIQEVQILCTANAPSSGLLTQTTVSMQRKGWVTKVREVRVVTPLSTGISGSWIVQGNRVLGVLVAICASGRSGFMLPMGNIFESVRQKLSRKVRLYAYASKHLGEDNFQERGQVSEAELSQSEVDSKEVVASKTSNGHQVAQAQLPLDPSPKRDEPVTEISGKLVSAFDSASERPSSISSLDEDGWKDYDDQSESGSHDDQEVLVGKAGYPNSIDIIGPKGRFTGDEDRLLRILKGWEPRMSWKQISDFFPRRNSATLQLRYCTKLAPSQINPQSPLDNIIPFAHHRSRSQRDKHTSIG
ncbi:MAG: hypothetical protein M1828_004015 [Chrysothrix sp. TS-e1954]|nr:MAG: hypothetical protein M1828_004015 [Chrysothrix sp. TS-e1954]